LLDRRRGFGGRRDLTDLLSHASALSFRPLRVQL
jgi:hypothetical protein